jgi:flagellar motility protein MotE (MotC chaperone)
MASEKDNSELYQALVVHYYGLRAKRQACLENINALEAKYKVLDEQLEQIHDILYKYGNYIYEHFEEEKQIVESED